MKITCMVLTMLLSASQVFAFGGSMEVPVAGDPGGGVTVCSTTPTYEITTHSAGTSLGSSNEIYYYAIKRINSESFPFCGLDLHIRGNGSLTGKDLVVELWSYSNATNDLTSKLEDIAVIDAATLPAVIADTQILTGVDVVVDQYEAIVIYLTPVGTGSINVTIADGAPTGSDWISSHHDNSGVQQATNGMTRGVMYGPE